MLRARFPGTTSKYRRQQAGDPAVLDDLVAEDLVNHAAGPQGREGLKRSATTSMLEEYDQRAALLKLPDSVKSVERSNGQQRRIEAIAAPSMRFWTIRRRRGRPACTGARTFLGHLYDQADRGHRERPTKPNGTFARLDASSHFPAGPSPMRATENDLERGP